MDIVMSARFLFSLAWCERVCLEATGTGTLFRSSVLHAEMELMGQKQSTSAERVFG